MLIYSVKFALADIKEFNVVFWLLTIPHPFVTLQVLLPFEAASIYS